MAFVAANDWPCRFPTCRKEGCSSGLGLRNVCDTSREQRVWKTGVAVIAVVVDAVQVRKNAYAYPVIGF